MARRIWYDRETIGAAAVDVGFFAYSQATHTSGKKGTNMELPAELPRAFACDRVGIRFPVVDSEASDNFAGGLLSDWQEILDGAVVEIEVSQEADIIIPVSEMLLPRSLGMQSAGFAELVHNGIANYVEELGCQSGDGGANVAFLVPAKTMLTVTLRLESTLSAEMTCVKVLLFGDEAES